ncbi:MAG: hypothetical protein AAF078_01790 [Planctomycetota bacterium]
MGSQQGGVTVGRVDASIDGEVLVLDADRERSGSAVLAGLAARGQRASAVRDEVEAMRRVVRGGVAAVVVVSATSSEAVDDLRAAVAEADASVEVMGWGEGFGDTRPTVEATSADLRGDAACAMDSDAGAASDGVIAVADEDFGEALTPAELDALLADSGEGW